MMVALCCYLLFALLQTSVHATNDDHDHDHDHSHDHGHHCIHDKIQERFKDQRVEAAQDYHNHPFDLWAQKREQEALLNQPQQQNHSSRVLLTQFPDLMSSNVFQPIRLFLDFSHLYSDPGVMCLSTTDTYKDEEGETHRCSKDDIASSEKLAFLIEQLLHPAKDFFRRALRVHPVQGPLKLEKGYQNKYNCVHTKIPQEHTSEGVSGFDYVLYITARPTQGDVVAWAGSCQWDQYGRPVAGQANFGPNRLNPTISPSKIAKQVSVAIHEISHALGFSSLGFDDFRDSTGAKRDKVVEEFQERGHTVHKIVTPAVTAAARLHFGCPTLNGVELENNGGGGTAGSHLEKRVFMNEFMTGKISDDPVMSAISLALFADSGWYTVDYAVTETLSWGKSMGCKFAQARCSEWPNEAKSAGMFCETALKPSCTGSLQQYKGYCNLAEFSFTLDSDYQYFKNPRLGGQNDLADFCPYIDTYDNGDCRVPANAAYNLKPLGETYGSSSRCFTNSLLHSDYKTQFRGNDRQGCYKTRCDSNGNLYVSVGGFEKKCRTAGGDLYFDKFEGVLTCPPASAMCKGSHCPNDCNGHGTCADGYCVCQAPYTGSMCEKSKKHRRTNAVIGITDDSSVTQPTTKGTNTPLIPGVPEHVTIGESGSDMKYFTTSVTVKPSDRVTVSVKPAAATTTTTTTGAGSVYAYLSFTNDKPSSYSNLARGSNSIVINPNTAGPSEAKALDDPSNPPRNLVPSYLHIGVKALTRPVTFEITLTLESAVCGDATCNGNGECVGGFCSCFSGYAGEFCESSDCPGTPDCSNHGTCSGSPPTCECREGWSGNDCSKISSTVGGEQISTKGGARAIKDLAPNAWKYHYVEVNADSISRIDVSFTLPACEDSSTFRDSTYKKKCSQWKGQDCRQRLLSSVREACPASCGLCPGKGTMLMAGFGTKPTMEGTSYTADAFDQNSWQENSRMHSFSINAPASGYLWIGVLNHKTYANGAVSGSLQVYTHYSTELILASCTREGTCTGHGECVMALCACDIFFHGVNCEHGLKALLASSSTDTDTDKNQTEMGSLIGKNYDYYFYEVTDEEAFTVTLDVTPVGESVSGAGSAGAAYPRIFVRRAPDLPVADQLAFTDFDSVANNSATHSVYIDTTMNGQDVWYIGVLNAAVAGSQPMDYKISVRAHRKNDRTTTHCQDWTSQTCMDSPTFECPKGSVMSNILHREIWFYPGDTDKPIYDLIEDSTCSDVSSKYKLCHHYTCPEATACLGKQQCDVGMCSTVFDADHAYRGMTTKELRAALNHTRLCPVDPRSANNSNGEHKCGLMMKFECRSTQSDNVCEADNNPCGSHGTCRNSNGEVICECERGWLGGDCKTPPPFQARLATSEVPTIFTVAQAFPVDSVTVDETPTEEPKDNEGGGVDESTGGMLAVYICAALGALGALAGLAYCIHKRREMKARHSKLEQVTDTEMHANPTENPVGLHHP